MTFFVCTAACRLHCDSAGPQDGKSVKDKLSKYTEESKEAAEYVEKIEKLEPGMEDMLACNSHVCKCW